MSSVFSYTSYLLHEAKNISECPAVLEGSSTDISINELLVSHLADGSYLFRVDNCGEEICAVLDKNKVGIQLYAERKEIDSVLQRFLLRSAFECRFCYEGVLSLHAACVDADGCAYAFTGKSGMGKSTRARAWIDALGAEWISGDRPAIRLTENGSNACGVPWDGKEQIYRDVEMPLRCIMEVRRSPANYIRRLSEEQAIRVLAQQSSIPMWDTDAAARALNNVQELARRTPVYRVFCGPDAGDARVIYDILTKHPEQIREEAEEMKIKDGFVLRNVVDEYIVMPTGENIVKFEGAVVLNEVSAFIFQQLENSMSRDDLLAALLNEFDVDEKTARNDLDSVLEQFRNIGFIDEE